MLTVKKLTVLVIILQLEAYENDPGFVDADKKYVLDLAWSPFNDNLLAASSESGAIKVWTAPKTSYQTISAG